MTNHNEVLLHKHTRREFRERMHSGELKACIVPVAATEQHLEHMAMEHDWRSACHIAVSVAENLSPHVLVAEGIKVGISEHHMKHIGTLSLSPASFMAALSDVIDSVIRAGFTNVLVLNGHGGNIVPCNAVWDDFLRKFQVNLHFLPYWDVLTQADAAELLKSGQRQPDDLPGHAQEFETAFALAVFPENVRTNMWTDQPDPTPAMATAEQGKVFVQRIVERVTKYTQEMINGSRTTQVPAYHP